MDVMAAVRGGFSKFDTSTQPALDEEEGEVESLIEEEEEKEETLALTALVLGLLAVTCLLCLALKSWSDARRERKKTREQKTSQSKLSVSTIETNWKLEPSWSFTSSAASVISANSTISTPPPRVKRLLSLSAGPFVYEKK